MEIEIISLPLLEAEVCKEANRRQPQLLTAILRATELVHISITKSVWLLSSHENLFAFTRGHEYLIRILGRTTCHPYKHQTENWFIEKHLTLSSEPKEGVLLWNVPTYFYKVIG